MKSEICTICGGDVGANTKGLNDVFDFLGVGKELGPHKCNKCGKWLCENCARKYAGNELRHKDCGGGLFLPVKS